MAISDGADVTVVKDQGVVTAVFADRTVTGLDGALAIGSPVAIRASTPRPVAAARIRRGLSSGRAHGDQGDCEGR